MYFIYDNNTKISFFHPGLLSRDFSNLPIGYLPHKTAIYTNYELSECNFLLLIKGTIIAKRGEEGEIIRSLK